ncbi:MAG: hypothetical protein ABIH52_02405 [Candidatus Aenigmatarchaeota archaeon]
MHTSLVVAMAALVILIVAIVVLTIFTGGLGGFGGALGGLECKANCERICIDQPLGARPSVAGCPDYNCVCTFSVGGSGTGQSIAKSPLEYSTIEPDG